MVILHPFIAPNWSSLIMADSSSPPPPYPYGGNFYSQAEDYSKDRPKRCWFTCSSSYNSLKDPRGKVGQKQTAITMDKKENENNVIVDRLDKMEKSQTQFAFAIFIIFLLGLLFAILAMMSHNKANVHLNGNNEELNMNEDKLSQMRETIHEQKILTKRLEEEVARYRNKMYNLWLEVDRLTSENLKLEKMNQALNNETQDESKVEERVVEINGVGNDGLFGFRLYENMIYSLIEGWPAKDSGLRPGDEIMSIDGVFYSTLTNCEINDLFEKARAKRSVTFVVRNRSERVKEAPIP